MDGCGDGAYRGDGVCDGLGGLDSCGDEAEEESVPPVEVGSGCWEEFRVGSEGDEESYGDENDRDDCGIF